MLQTNKLTNQTNYAAEVARKCDIVCSLKRCMQMYTGFSAPTPSPAEQEQMMKREMKMMIDDESFDEDDEENDQKHTNFMNFTTW